MGITEVLFKAQSKMSLSIILSILEKKVYPLFSKQNFMYTNHFYCNRKLCIKVFSYMILYDVNNSSMKNRYFYPHLQIERSRLRIKFLKEEINALW